VGQLTSPGWAGGMPYLAAMARAVGVSGPGAGTNTASR